MIRAITRTIQYWTDWRPMPLGLKTVEDTEYTSLADAELQELDDRVEQYFSSRLDMFPTFEDESRLAVWKWFSGPKPSRFFVLWRREIGGMFPDDQDLRDLVRIWTERQTKGLILYIVLKRLLWAAALVGGFWALTVGGGRLQGAPPIGIALGLMAVIAIVYAGASQLADAFYKVRLSSDAGRMSRLIIQRTQDLRRLFVTLRALPDQLETKYPDGKEWGMRSRLIIRLTLWAGKRMEFLERYIQVEMWRLVRERFWTNIVALFSLITMAGLAAWEWTVLAPPAWAEGFVPAWRVIGYVWLALVSLASFILWTPPVKLTKKELTPESWIRYGDIDLDGAVGDQVRRDKERLVEYRNINKR